MEKKLTNATVIIALTAVMLLISILTWKLFPVPEIVEELSLQPEDIDMTYEESSLLVDIDYTAEDVQDRINLSRLDGIEPYLVTVNEDGGIHIAVSIPYDQIKGSVLEEIHARQEEIRRAEAAAAVGMNLATYPLDVDSVYFKLADRMVQIAREEPELAEDSSGITKYGKYFGHPSAEWCTEFALWCEIQAENELNDPLLAGLYPKRDYADACIRYYRSKGTYFPRGDYVPRMGDLIFFDIDFDGSSDHTGMVTKVEYNEAEDMIYVFTIEGNIPGDSPSTRIRQRKFRITTSNIMGYGTYIIE